MFEDDFVKILFGLCLVILLFYIFQPSFWTAHPGIIKFFNPDYSAPTPRTATPDSSGAKLTPTPARSGYVSIAGVSLSSAGDYTELRLLVSGSSPSAIDLQGWQIKTSYTTITLPVASVLPSGIFIISSKNAPVSGGASQTYYLGQKFLGSSDSVYLYSKSGTLVDKYTY